MQQRYIRTIGALSEAELGLLRSKKVFVAGCGGLGGHVIDMLLRIGVGEIRVCDGDSFDETNLNSQLLANETSTGRSKAETAAEYARKVNSSVLFSADNVFLTEENAPSLIAGCDAVIDALDSIASRMALKKACDALKIPYIYGAVNRWTAQAAISMPNDGLIGILYPQADINVDKSILSFTVALCASVQVSLCVKLLCGRDVECGKVYYFDLEDMELHSFKLIGG